MGEEAPIGHTRISLSYQPIQRLSQPLPRQALVPHLGNRSLGQSSPRGPSQDTPPERL